MHLVQALIEGEGQRLTLYVLVDRVPASDGRRNAHKTSQQALGSRQQMRVAFVERVPQYAVVADGVLPQLASKHLVTQTVHLCPFGCFRERDPQARTSRCERRGKGQLRPSLLLESQASCDSCLPAQHLALDEPERACPLGLVE